MRKAANGFLCNSKFKRNVLNCTYGSNIRHASSSSGFVDYYQRVGPSNSKELPERTRPNMRLTPFSITYFYQETMKPPENGTTLNPSEFMKWPNGGGLYHTTASINPTALLETGAIVHSNSKIDADVHISSGTVVGPFVSIGHSTKVRYNASLSNCFIGNSCMVHNGVCIGQDGFGFFVDEGRVVKKPQEMKVKIGDHVEIGANTCIDRGSWRDTTIGDHTKIDNLVQIGHNVVMGKCCILCGQVGVAGSVTMGDYVVMGGRSAAKDHVSIASKVRIAGNSCVIKDITEPGDYGGFPAVPIHEWRRQSAKLRNFYRTM